MSSKDSTVSNQKKTQSNAAAQQRSGAAVSFSPPAYQRQALDQPLGEKLSDYNETSAEDVQPFTKAVVQNKNTVQRVPTGTYGDATPNANGTYWDTADTVTHNHVIVPSASIAVMKRPVERGAPSVNPPGWQWLQNKFGRLKGDWVRFHIINAKLGGPGNRTSNLVPTKHALNHDGGWRRMEDAAKASATTDDDWTYLEVDINYDDDFPAGIPESIDAEWGYYNDDDDEWVMVADDVHLEQLNPKDGNANNNYLPAAQVTQGNLRENFGLSLAQARKIKQLTGVTWNSQNEFDEAMDEALNDNGNLNDNNWHYMHARLYVNEDDDIAGPYGVLVKTT